MLGDDGLPVRAQRGCGRRGKNAAGLDFGARSAVVVAAAGAAGPGAFCAGVRGVEWRLRASRVAVEDGVIERENEEEEKEEEGGGMQQVMFENHRRDVDTLLQQQGEIAAAALADRDTNAKQETAAATTTTHTPTTTTNTNAPITRRKRKPPAYWASEENVRKEVEMFWAKLGVKSNKVGGGGDTAAAMLCRR